jgi:hypothetical protein
VGVVRHGGAVVQLLVRCIRHVLYARQVLCVAHGGYLPLPWSPRREAPRRLRGLGASFAGHGSRVGGQCFHGVQGLGPLGCPRVSKSVSEFLAWHRGRATIYARAQGDHLRTCTSLGAGRSRAVRGSAGRMLNPGYTQLKALRLDRINHLNHETVHFRA